MTLLLPLLLACTEYEVVEKDDNVEAPMDSEVLLPALVLSPESIALTGLCGEATEEVTLSNAGEATLHVTDIRVEGVGWELGEVEMPLVLEPADSVEVPIVASGGVAELVVLSDDPEDPERRLPLSAALDQAPELTLISPVHETIIVDPAEVLETHVYDDVDPPESLTVRWASNQEGLIAELVPDATGFAEGPWGEDHLPGDHTLTASVLDSCGNYVEESITVCQQQANTIDLLDDGTWNYEGSANYDSANGWINLTPALMNQSGTAFSTAATVTADSVEMDFLFYQGDGSGADGIALVALNADQMTGFVGSSGGGIGYGGLPGWSVEVDTYYNGYDPTPEDHVAFSWNGDVSAHTVWAALPEMENNGWHSMQVNVQAPRVRVTIDGTTYINQDVSGDFNFPAYVGFAAGTGSLTNNHRIDALVVTELSCEEG